MHDFSFLHDSILSVCTGNVPFLSISFHTGGPIRPVKNSSFRVFDIPGIKLLTRLRVHCSDLNEHRFRHAFDCITPVCIRGLANEDNEHFFLHCPQYHALRLNLFDQISDIPGIDLTYFDESLLCDLLLYGNPFLH